MEVSGMGNASATRNTAGCWTCRVRRKKCDKNGPVCHICSALLITCVFTETKPDWVDGGEKQQAMAEHFKQEVRDKAPQRRSLAYAKAADEPMTDADVQTLHAGDPSTDPPQDPAEMLLPGQGQEIGLNDSMHSFLDVSGAGSRDRRSAIDRAGLDRGFIACYLDFYFPFLFPFYQPSILDRGRAWVIDFITDSRVMEQATLSLSSYFFSLALETRKSGHETCRQLAWNKLLGQIHSTFGLLQDELRRLTAEAPSEYLPRAVPIMGCILMLQRFETTVGSFENGQAHLSAAIELFEQVIADAEGTCGSNNRWASRFGSYVPPWPGHYQTFRASSSEQMAFRFFSALLLVDDIVASTALGEEPRLHAYHENILGNGQWSVEGDEKMPLRLDSIVGCQNWAMVAVAKISVLNAWKKQQRAAGDLDMMELVRRATAIKDVLVANLARADDVASSAVSADRNNPWDIFTPWSDQASVLAMHGSLVTRIWAHAAAIYLSIVVSGWQPASSEVRHQVARILELLTQQVLSPAVLRTVAWPFCVAGCLAEPAQEPLFRGLVEALRPPGLHGPLRKALEVMDDVWRSRESLDGATWDIAACFRQPGHMILLV